MSSFDYLPLEICYEIFDYLSVDELKKASLTCRRWYHIIFSDFYIQRFRLIMVLFRTDRSWMVKSYNEGVERPVNIDLNYFPSLSPRPIKYKLRKMSQKLRRSCRHYRNVTIICRIWREFTDNVFSVIMKLLPPKGLQWVEELTIFVDFKLNASITPYIAPFRNMTQVNLLNFIYQPWRKLRNGTELMMWRDPERPPLDQHGWQWCGLEHLRPRSNQLERIWYNKTPLNFRDLPKPQIVIDSDIIKCIKLEMIDPMQINLPKLESLDCSLDYRGEHKIINQTFEHLKILKLATETKTKLYDNGSSSVIFPNANEIEQKVNFFQRHDKLETLIIDEFNTSEDIFEAICKTCRNLVELKITALDIGFECTTLHNLLFLKNLKVLSLPTISANSGESLINEIQRLNLPPNLESLHMDVSIDWFHSFSSFVNLKYLAIGSYSRKTPEAVDAIVMNIKQLQELRLRSQDDERVSPRTFRTLSCLETLRKLELTGGHLGGNVFDQCPPPEGEVSNLERIVFISCTLQTEDFGELRHKFPKLRNLRFERCRYNLDVKSWQVSMDSWT